MTSLTGLWRSHGHAGSRRYLTEAQAVISQCRLRLGFLCLRYRRLKRRVGQRSQDLVDCSCTHQIQRRSRQLVGSPLQPHRVDAGRGEGAVNLEQHRYDASLFVGEAESRSSAGRRELSFVTDQLQRCSSDTRQRSIKDQKAALEGWDMDDKDRPVRRSAFGGPSAGAVAAVCMAEILGMAG